MRLYQQMYFGNLALGLVPGSGGSPASNGKPADCPTSFVRSNMAAEGAFALGVDFVEIERQARAARSAWVGAKLQSVFQALVRKFERAGPAKESKATSHDIAKLEQRVRRDERMQPLYH